MNPYADLAKKSIKEYIGNNRIISAPSNLPAEFYKKQGGVFVTIHRGKQLRGCIGTYLPARASLAEEIIHNAISAATQDERFPTILPREMPSLNFEVSVLSEPQKIKDISELNPKKFGVIVKSSGGKCGLLLPNLEGIRDAEEQLFIACKKGGINMSKDNDLEIYRFEIKKYRG